MILLKEAMCTWWKEKVGKKAKGSLWDHLQRVERGTNEGWEGEYNVLASTGRQNFEEKDTISHCKYTRKI